ncbi:unnamed protein product [Coregonus sp. 'balchen']|nr:unnamed protein product [Coregonus sp. 'balchen']
MHCKELPKNRLKRWVRQAAVQRGSSSSQPSGQEATRRPSPARIEKDWDEVMESLPLDMLFDDLIIEEDDDTMKRRTRRRIPRLPPPDTPTLEYGFVDMRKQAAAKFNTDWLPPSGGRRLGERLVRWEEGLVPSPGTVLVLYFRYFLRFDDDLATSIYHTFVALCYLTPILGAIIADSWLGKFKTIIYLSIVYAIGQVVMAVSAVHDITDTDRDGTQDNLTT